jgi:hypothetical protein
MVELARSLADDLKDRYYFEMIHGIPCLTPLMSKTQYPTDYTYFCHWHDEITLFFTFDHEFDRDDPSVGGASMEARALRINAYPDDPNMYESLKAALNKTWELRNT